MRGTRDFITQTSKLLRVLLVLLLGIAILAACSSVPYEVEEWSVGGSHKAVTDPHLDLHQQVWMHREEAGAPLVAFGPAIVAGQGAHEDNATVVKVFDRYQTLQTQFLAYDPGVKGGVQVAAGAFTAGETWIATAPIADTEVRQIRFFDPEGLLRAVIEPVDDLTPPYLIAAGNFVTAEDAPQQLAVMARSMKSGQAVVKVWGVDGTELAEFELGHDPLESDLAHMTVVHGDNRAGFERAVDRLLVQFAQHVEVIDLSISESVLLELGGLQEGFKVYPGTADSGDWVATGAEEFFSHMQVFASAQSAGELVNIGHRENQFWSNIAEAVEDGSGYVHRADFLHLRVDQMSTNYRHPVNYDSTEFSDWIGDNFANRAHVGNMQERYHREAAVWEPTATHRHHAQVAQAWSEPVDEDGLPLYQKLGRRDRPEVYREGTTAFVNLTYATGFPELDRLRYWTLRAYLQELAVEFRGEERGNPEHLVGLVPVHEHEVYAPVDQSVGDYNPMMIRGFLDYLFNVYPSLEEINNRFETPFASEEDFDAPRNEGRGEWDAYKAMNAFYGQWVKYNRYVVNRHIVSSYREAVLAGFPPEVIKSHQIPEGYAVPAFLGGDGLRITPVDVVLSLGAGYGGTRYGVWFRNPSNWLNDAWRSGHHMTVVGEYSAREGNQRAVRDQLQYLFEHGAIYTHEMDFRVEAWWIAAKVAMQDLQDSNAPRPGTTGGTGQILPVVSPAASSDQGSASSYQIAQIGYSDQHNGLLKSVLPDGSWEGTVYLIPFHNLLHIEDLAWDASGQLDGAGLSFPVIERLQHGDQVELRFLARAAEQNTLKVTATHDGVEWQLVGASYEVDSEWKSYRYVLSNQLPLEDVVLNLSGAGIEWKDAVATVQRQQVARKYYHITAAQAHRGGVHFDIWSREDE